MNLDITIADIFKTKPVWISEGIVAHSAYMPERNVYSPKVGMVFTASVSRDMIGKKELTKWERDATGIYQGSPVYTRDREVKKVFFTVDQTIRTADNPTGVLDEVDPDTSEAVQVFPAHFLKKFQETPFFEVAGNLLVAPAICIDPRDVIPGGTLAADLPLAITFTMELYKKDDGKLCMLERAYWSDGYKGDYCCA